MRGESHVVFGLAGAVVIDGLFQLSGPRLLDPHTAGTRAHNDRSICTLSSTSACITPDRSTIRPVIGL